MATAASPPAAASARASGIRSRAGRLSLPAALPADGRGDTATTYKELGLYSWKRRIEDAVIRVELSASNALEREEARRIEHEEVLQSHNLWDNPAKSHETLSALSDAIRAVDHLKDLLYKVLAYRCIISNVQAEEAKLISQLAGMDVINGELFKQAYDISLDASEFLDRYQMYELLKGPYDKEGACIMVTAGSEGVASELWAEKLFDMYTSWAQRQGCKEGLVEKIASTSGHTQFAAMEIESEYMFGTLSGEKGMHRMIYSSVENSGTGKISPLPGEFKNRDRRNGATVRVQHIPSGVTAESSGERSYFANKLKAVSRLKAKLLIITRELRVPNLKMIEKQAVEERCNRETRRYTFGPQEFVHDLNTGIQLSDLNSVLEGDIEPFIRGRIVSRHG
ncbi:Peptide chain release factor 2 [Triticum urartu]|uniref:Peptide chain release factor 2 n=1 Tax=Triticum urartu TaxID=4572 RepID=M7ZGV4_TRIUA|nr:Peptide chain release factor 2 [Triticum urartu]